MAVIKELCALEILDSRGRPTVEATCILENGAKGVASVPSGASSGSAEAVELRDGDSHRFGGLGCLKAVDHVNSVIVNEVKGRNWTNQEALDLYLLELDGTSNKSRLGANTILAVSLAFCRASCVAAEIPLYRHLAAQMGWTPDRLPRPTINLFSGGLHAGGQVAIQDVLVVPARADTVMDALADTYAVYQAAARLASEQYGYRLLRADEGGLAPPFEDDETMLKTAVKAIENAGFRPGEDVSLALDVASSHFVEGKRYMLGCQALSSIEMIEVLAGWVDRYPIVSLEDGLAEDDWDHWPALRSRIAGKTRVVGDDLLCTNPSRIETAVDLGAADTLLLKVNQIGTLTEAAQACKLANNAGWHITASARSGETEDHWLADLAVGWKAHQIKIGSITQSERLAKYNQLVRIEKEAELPLQIWPNN